MASLCRVVALLGCLLVAAASSGSNQSAPPQQPSQRGADGPPPPQQMDTRMALGPWKSSFGPVKIQVDDSRGNDHLMGVWVYDRDGQEVIGYFSGAIGGNVMTFTWNEPAQPQDLAGSGYVVFDVSGRSFSGKWWTSNRDRGGQWNGWRADSAGGDDQGPGDDPDQPPGPADLDDPGRQPRGPDDGFRR
jgi:hypothetical protein